MEIHESGAPIQNSVEKKEQEPRREISLWFVRHGESDNETNILTPKGKEQSASVAKEILSMIGEGEAIKYYTSPTERAQQMAEEMQQAMAQKIEEDGKDVVFLNTLPRKREDFRDAGFNDALDEAAKEAGFSQKEIMDFWTSNPSVDGVESPVSVEARFREGVQHFSDLASRVKQNGPKINFVIPTHSEVPTPQLDKIYGVKGLAPGQWMRMDFRAGETDSIKYFRKTLDGDIETVEGEL